MAITEDSRKTRYGGGKADRGGDDCSIVVTDTGLDVCCTVDTDNGLEVECTDILTILKPE